MFYGIHVLSTDGHRWVWNFIGKCVRRWVDGPADVFEASSTWFFGPRPPSRRLNLSMCIVVYCVAVRTVDSLQKRARKRFCQDQQRDNRKNHLQSFHFFQFCFHIHVANFISNSNQINSVETITTLFFYTPLWLQNIDTRCSSAGEATNNYEYKSACANRFYT